MSLNPTGHVCYKVYLQTPVAASRIHEREWPEVL